MEPDLGLLTPAPGGALKLDAPGTTLGTYLYVTGTFEGISQKADSAALGPA